jgi:hypothetical protein
MIHTIVWLQSTYRGRLFPYAESVGDTDMEEDWRVALTSVARPEIVMVKIAPGESADERWMQLEQPALLRFEARINRELSRDDLRVSWRCIAAEDWAGAPEARSIADFPSPPTSGYADIYHRGRVARVVRCESIEEFRAAGGVFVVR